MDTATAEQPYRAACAGCGERRAFETVEQLAEWTSGHHCWEDIPRD